MISSTAGLDDTERQEIKRSKTLRYEPREFTTDYCDQHEISDEVIIHLEL